jgi:hypothetical protein
VVAEGKGDTAMLKGGLECRPALLANSLPIITRKTSHQNPVTFQVASIELV